MRTRPVVPAAIVFVDGQPPRSPDHDDVYHPASGALAQARHVFIAGHGLPERWRGRDRFVVLETGFGLGHNALATWQTWRGDPARPGRLVFLTVEARPPTREQLLQAPRDPSLAAVLHALADAWPPPTHGLHRLCFEGGRVELLLAFGTVADWLPQLRARVDAFDLDGFAPARNPQMWEPRLYKAIARLAAPDATVATWSAARAVREGLHAAGFAVRVAPGQGGKRDITLATYAPRATVRTRTGAAGPSTPPRRVAVIGTGLAGAATAQALAAQGVDVVCLDGAAAPATGASGNPAGLFHGVVHPDDGWHARWHRAAALAVARELRAVDPAVVPHEANGLLRLVPERDVAQLAEIAARWGLPPGYAEAVDAGEASARAGLRLDAAAWWYAQGGWVDAGGLVRHRLACAAADGAQVRLHAPVARLERCAGGWRLLDAAGQTVVDAEAVVCANGIGLDGLMARSGLAPPMPLVHTRGQLSAIDAPDGVALPRVPVAGSGYALARGRTLWFGTRTSVEDDEPVLRAADHAHNVERLQRMLPSCRAADLGAAAWTGRVGWRVAVADRLPLAGPVPEALPTAGAPAGDASRFEGWPAVPGLWMVGALGSRGIASSRLAGDLVAARLTGAPWPVEVDLAAAVDPARHWRRARRRAGVGGSGEA